ncbi:hypothetical protein SEA_MAIH_29 [Streptomyces phage Maih]|uniref:Uncharacterized protein n=5 Tax=Woodruffvirus TP1604 TaxID=1982746 RepID=A0A1P8VVY4_9CAUD|nr:hypothetical protein AVT62_gp29 [Streptomyces phage TP1604]ALY07279.1 hypothetical protein SEA_MAIH_29 [Streptomyces phage Maih]APZ82197.1 hypothetical protein SEA_BABYGOTBAC_29 [Streptomyces phage BabyGotBac]AWN08389.1 hypothetical protein SEA_BAYC_29 [Streptomyces phage BayC]AWN08460.1 hypothetical protein SEA_SALETE_29 [Streptomyces phage Salete]USH45404.1 hypothetical protein SEA_ASIS_29 [Streptomyces phage Asis]
MQISDASGVNVAAELAMLRGEMTTGFERIAGQLNLIAQAQTATATDVSELERRVTALEARRWPIGVIAAVSGAVSAVVAIGAFLVGQ